eukprot:scaffold80702_cov36-Prasinocladus_malaysianus.AAC.1
MHRFKDPPVVCMLDCYECNNWYEDGKEGMQRLTEALNSRLHLLGAEAQLCKRGMVDWLDLLMGNYSGRMDEQCGGRSWAGRCKGQS